VGEYHDAPARHAPQLREAARAIRPVVDRQNRERGVHARVAQRERGRNSAHTGRGVCGALAKHRERGLDRDHAPVARLVGAGAGTDVHHARRVAERSDDRRLDARIRDAQRAVADADAVVELAHAADCVAQLQPRSARETRSRG
jgi:hypothetical protein